jgi:ketosteroid isomerase-like protein
MRSLLLAAVLVLPACRSQSASPEYTAFRLTQESAAAQTAIDAINIRYMRYTNGNMADSIASLFTEQAALMPPDAPPVLGRDSIRAYFAAHPLPAGANMTFAAVDVHAVGPMAVEVGGYSLTVPTPDNAKPRPLEGKYVAHWRNVNGRWLQAALIWNEDAPASPMPATAPPKRP